MSDYPPVWIYRFSIGGGFIHREYRYTNEPVDVVRRSVTKWPGREITDLGVLAATDMVKCPMCDGTGESEHWTTCPLCDFHCSCPRSEALRYVRDELARWHGVLMELWP